MSWGHPAQRKLGISVFGPGDFQDYEFFRAEGLGPSNAEIPLIFRILNFSMQTSSGIHRILRFSAQECLIRIRIRYRYKKTA